MRQSIITLFLIFLVSCTLKFYPLKGNYPPTPIVYTTEKSFDQVWSNLVDLFAQKGISIRIIDKSSGLIASERTKLSTSYEDSKGKLYSPKAFVVLKRNNYQGDENMKKSYFDVTGEWNVHLKQEANDVSVNINIVNIEGEQVYTSLYHGETRSRVTIRAQTTGVFEKLIFEAVK